MEDNHIFIDFLWWIYDIIEEFDVIYWNRVMHKNRSDKI
jgi:hypothetical protein